MTDIAIWDSSDVVYESYRVRAAVGVSGAGLVVFLSLAAVFTYQSLRLSLWLARWVVLSLLFTLGSAYSVAAQPFWLVFGFLWPKAFGGDAFPLPPFSSEFNGERLQGGYLQSNLPVEVGERRLPVSAHLECARLRRRALWVRRLEHVLGPAVGSVGLFVKGRWVPDLPLPHRSTPVNFVLAHAIGGAKILGGGSITTGSGDSQREEIYVVVEFSNGSRETVFPELVAGLAAYALLRERNAILLTALRSRAVEWCKTAGLGKSVSFWAVVSALKMVWTVSKAESDLALACASGCPTFPSLLSVPT